VTPVTVTYTNAMQEMNNHTTHASNTGYLGTSKEINIL
jgi:hypothetical protein